MVTALANQQSYSTSGHKVTLCRAWLVLGWATFWPVNHLSISPNHLGQLGLLPSVGQVISTSQKCSDALQLGSKGRYGSFYLWISVWVAYLSTLEMSHDEVLYESTVTLPLTSSHCPVGGEVLWWTGGHVCPLAHLRNSMSKFH